MGGFVMRRSTVIVMGILGSVLLLALVGLMASAALTPSVSIELKKAPEWVFPMEEVSLSYWVNLTGYTSDSVTHTAAHWDTVSHAGQGYWDISWYPNVSNALTGTPDGNYTVHFTAPNITGKVYFILHAVVDGVDYTSVGEYDIEVKKAHEAWIEVLSAPGAGLTSHSVTVSWRVHNITKDRRTGSTLYWDIKSNAGTMAVGSYPHIVEGMTDGADDDCDGLVPLPDEACTVYFIITASVQGLPDVLMSPGEGTIICKSSPKLAKATAVSPALVDSVVTVNWTISYLDSDIIDITETAIVWSLQSHDSRAASGEIFDILKQYDVSTPSLGGVAGGRYAVDITMPSTPCTVYYRAYAIVLGQPFMTEEAEIGIVSEPLLKIKECPARAMSWSIITVRANLSYTDALGLRFPMLGSDALRPKVELRADVRSHSDFSSYLALEAIPAELTMTTPNYKVDFLSTTEDQYFVLRCLFLGEWFWCAEERRVQVVSNYTFVVETTFDYLLPNELATFEWRVDTGVPSDIEGCILVWDTVEHGYLEGFEYYANMENTTSGPDGRFSATLKAPSTPGHIYVLIVAVMLDVIRSSPPIHPIEVVEPPTIGDVSYKGTVEQGKELKVTFTIANATAANLTLLELRWDTLSHAGSSNASLYPNVVNIMPDADGTYEVTIKAPKKKEVYFVVHAEAYGRDFLAQGEGKVDVKEPTPGIGGTLALGALALAGTATVLHRRGRK
jgi:hypothetical protein